jgi:hypothetical protein
VATNNDGIPTTGILPQDNKTPIQGLRILAPGTLALKIRVAETRTPEKKEFIHGQPARPLHKP